MNGLTVGFKCSRLTAATSCLINCLDNEDVLSATLQAMNSVVVLLDIGHNHPAVSRVAETWVGKWDMFHCSCYITKLTLSTRITDPLDQVETIINNIEYNLKKKWRWTTKLLKNKYIWVVSTFEIFLFIFLFIFLTTMNILRTYLVYLRYCTKPNWKNVYITYFPSNIICSWKQNLFNLVWII